jgi:hypothetical protein
MQKGFAPPLEMDVPGFLKHRSQFPESVQRKVPILPDVPVNRAGAIDAGCIAGRGDLYLNPVKGRSNGR